jgi:hypothetical protein
MNWLQEDMDFDQRKQKFSNNVKAMEEPALEFSWEDQEIYKMWLAQTFYIVRHTSHFICIAAGLVPVENRVEHYHMIEHLKEEEHHDALLVRDLASFGTEYSAYPELPETQMVWQNLYYWLSLRKPRAILGHSLCIEGLAGSIGDRLLPRMRARYHNKGISFLHLHFEADKLHFEQGLDLMKSFPNEDLNDIATVQAQSSILYTGMLKAIEKQVASTRLQTKDLRYSA